VIGGSDGGTPLDTIERLELFPDGYIGAPTVVGRLVTARTNHTSVIVGDSIYVIGGRGATGAIDTVERILIGETHAPAAAGSLHGKRTGALLVAAGNHVYVMGGSDENGLPITTFERASIISHTSLLPTDGVNLDSFAAVPSATLRFPMSYPSTLVLGNTLYVIGGATSFGATATVDKATINEDGTFGDFQPSGVTLNTARMAHASFVYNNDLYVLGGRTSVDFSTYTQSVERAHIGADGSLGPFETIGLTLDVPRGYFKAAVIGRALYVFAGVSNGGAQSPTFVATIKTTPVDTTTGILAPFTTHSTLTDPRAFHTSIVLSSKVYLFTGKTTTASYIDGVVAPIGTDSSVGTFGTAGQNPTKREGSVLVAAGDAVFAIGGTFSVMLQPTTRSTADATDAPGTFLTQATGLLLTPRYGHAALTIGNRIYVLAGFDGANLLNSFEAATIR
jgi:hypothetical protein